jgi:hypothetical protein
MEGFVMDKTEEAWRQIVDALNTLEENDVGLRVAMLQGFDVRIVRDPDAKKWYLEEK